MALVRLPLDCSWKMPPRTLVEAYFAHAVGKACRNFETLFHARVVGHRFLSLAGLPQFLRARLKRVGHA